MVIGYGVWMPLDSLSVGPNSVHSSFIAYV